MNGRVFRIQILEMNGAPSHFGPVGGYMRASLTNSAGGGGGSLVKSSAVEIKHIFVMRMRLAYL